MPDSMAQRYLRKEKQDQLEQVVKRTKTADEIKAEEELVKNTKKVEPIHADAKPDRNAACPCGSGKKYKKCCGAKA